MANRTRPRVRRNKTPLRLRYGTRPAPSRVFVCYRREDSAGHAGRLYDGLVSHYGRQNVFIDTEDIAIGRDFPSEVRQALLSSDVVLVVLGPRWLDVARQRLGDPEDHLRREIETAFEANRRVLPVLVEGARMPDPEELPQSIRWLAYRHAARLDDHDWHEDLHDLVERLEEQKKPRNRFAGPRELRELAPLPHFIRHALVRPLNVFIGLLVIVIGIWRVPWLIGFGIGVYLLLTTITFFEASEADRVGSRFHAAGSQEEEIRPSA